MKNLIPFLICLCLLTPAYGKENPAAQAAIANARKMYTSKNYAKAIADINKYLAAYKNDVDGYILRSEIYTGLQQPALAKADSLLASRLSALHDTASKTYMDSIQRKIKANWFPPRYTARMKASAIFKIFPDGSIEQVKISKSSGNAEFDQSGIITCASSNSTRRQSPKR